jgi:hypothetical protein
MTAKGMTAKLLPLIGSFSFRIRTMPFMARKVKARTDRFGGI